MKWRSITLSFVLTVTSACAVLSDGEAGGPWKAQIVDAEAGKPLEGVVVLAYWIKYEASVGGWAAGKYYDSEEVVTGPDGRFVIQSRWSYTIPGITKVSGPEWVIFKPGYGQWRLRPGTKSFGEGEDAIIELLALKTREERLEFLRSVTWSGVMPQESTRKLRDARDLERRYLGLGR